MSYSCLPLNTHPTLEADSSPSEPPGNPTLITAAVNFTYLCLSLGQALFLFHRLPRVHAYLAQSAAQQDRVRRAMSHLGSATKMPPVTPLKSFNLICTHMQVQSCLTLCNPMDCSPPGSSVHGIFQASILEWVAISFSKGSSWPRDQTCISCVSCTDRQRHLGKPSSNLG